MPRRGRRPTFGSAETARLLEEMGNVRSAVSRCGGAAGYSSPRHAKCEAVQHAIDALAEDLTGDPQYYWIKVVPRTGRR